MTGEQQRSQARHQRILDAALDVFARRGYRDAAVDDIAAASETSKGGVYFHFPNKGAIFKALLQRTARLLLERAEAAIARESDPIARVDAALVTVLRLFAEHRTLARLFLVEALGAGAEFSAALMEIHAEFARLIARHLDEAVQAGAIAPLDTALAGVAWFGALNEVMVRWALTGQPERLEDAYPALRALLLRGVGAPVGGYSYGGGYVVTAAPILAPDHLRARLRAGVERARQAGEPVLVSLSTRLPALDPLDFFAQTVALSSDRFYWEQHADGVALAGAGAAHIVEPDGIAAAGTAWRALLANALIDDDVKNALSGPLLFGGFGFTSHPPLPHAGTHLSPSRSEGNEWADFPAARLTLPRLALATTGGASVLTVNTMLAPDADVEAEAARLLYWCETLFPPRPHADSPASGEITVENMQSRQSWEALVARGAAACRDGTLEKVVLARAVRVHAAGELDAATALRRLRDAYPHAYVFAVQAGERCFLGATPERLVRLRDHTAHVTCLAGSAPRGGSPEEDAYLGNALLASAKDRAEHELVVRGVREALAAVSAEVRAPGAPRLLRLHNVQHLYTPVEARAGDGVTLLDLVARLHPTPAVGGYPREAALRFIAEHENMERGWYAGPVGWLDACGGGEFAVALRSALLHGDTATLFAGCGIVAGSIPSDEYAETCLKLRPMLSALGAQQEPSDVGSQQPAAHEAGIGLVSTSIGMKQEAKHSHDGR